MSDVQSQINSTWNGAASEYDALPRHGLRFPEETEAWRAALAALMPPPPAAILDVGTGTGFLALLLAQMGHRVRGVDLAEGMLAQARSKATERGLNVRFEPGDAMDPPGEPASLDAIVSRHVFWTLTDPERALYNWRRLLRPGGTLLIIDGLWGVNADPERKLEYEDSLPMTKVSALDDVKALVEAAGFEAVEEGSLGRVGSVEMARWGKTEEHRYVIRARKAAE